MIGFYSERGPCFTGGEACELGAYLNGDGKCESSANETGYNIPLKDGINMLTNKKDGEFTITELEVWEVEYIVKYNIKSIIYRTDKNKD